MKIHLLFTSFKTSDRDSFYKHALRFCAVETESFIVSFLKYFFLQIKCLLIFFHQKNPEKYNLVEVLLDKGVAERMLDREERPWELIQQARKVS